MSSNAGTAWMAVAAKSNQATGAVLILVAVTLMLGLGLRAIPWTQYRSMEDEALYGFWGMQIASGTDPMLTHEAVDKPPLHAYVLALSFRLFGPNVPSASRQLEAAARLPSLFASVAGIALTFALGRQLFGDPLVGLVAALFLALSPFDISFAFTAYTDPLLTAMVLGALLAASRGKLLAAGLLSGLAVATKQQGLLFVPLVVALGLVRPNPRVSWRGQWLRFALAFAVVVGGAFAWDSARIQRPGFLLQSLNSYGGLRLASAPALPERGVSWLRLLATLWGSQWLVALVVVAAAALLLPMARRWSIRSPMLAAPRRKRWSKPGMADLILALFATGFFLVHWLFTVQVWDRYLLPLVPLLALLGARALVALGRQIRRQAWQGLFLGGVSVLFLATVSVPVVRAEQGKLAVGGDHGTYDGIDELASYVRAYVPAGAVLYDYWLGYHYRFYLYGARLRIHWYPDMVDLVRDAGQYRRQPRFISFPSWHDSTPSRAALAAAGIRLVPVYQAVRRDGSTSFDLFRMEGP